MRAPEFFCQHDRDIIDAAAKSLGDQPSMPAMMGLQMLMMGIASHYYYAGSKFGWLRHPPRPIASVPREAGPTE